MVGVGGGRAGGGSRAEAAEGVGTNHPGAKGDLTGRCRTFLRPWCLMGGGGGMGGGGTGYRLVSSVPAAG